MLSVLWIRCNSCQVLHQIRSSAGPIFRLQLGPGTSSAADWPVVKNRGTAVNITILLGSERWRINGLEISICFQGRICFTIHPVDAFGLCLPVSRSNWSSWRWYKPCQWFVTTLQRLKWQAYLTRLNLTKMEHIRQYLICGVENGVICHQRRIWIFPGIKLIASNAHWAGRHGQALLLFRGVTVWNIFESVVNGLCHDPCMPWWPLVIPLSSVS